MKIITNGQSSLGLSSDSRIWLRNLAKIKLGVDQATLDILLNPGTLPEARDRFNSRIVKNPGEYSAWVRDYETSRKADPLTTEEAMKFVTCSNDARIWHFLYASMSEIRVYTNRDDFCQVQAMSKVFEQLGEQLSATASSFDVSDLGKTSDVVVNVQEQLGVLHGFSSLSKRQWGKERVQPEYDWVRQLNQQIKNARNDNKTRSSSTVRSPKQHRQDNLILHGIVIITILGCIYSLFRAMASSPSAPGSTQDTDFWQQVLNSTVQLSGFLTLFLPIYRETAAKEWIGTWIITSLGCGSAIVAIPLYLTVPISWSVFFTWLAAACQLVVVLQVAMVAEFQERDRTKKVD